MYDLSLQLRGNRVNMLTLLTDQVNMFVVRRHEPPVYYSNRFTIMYGEHLKVFLVLVLKHAFISPKRYHAFEILPSALVLC